MGYRSDIAYLILFPSDAEYYGFLSEAHVLSGQPIRGEGFDNLNGNSHWGDMRSALAETVHGVGRYDQPYISLDGVYYKFPTIAFKAEDVKWYPSYPDVHSHESLIRLARLRIDNSRKQSYPTGTNSTTMMTRCALSYLRIGEDDNDIERYAEGTHIAMFGANMSVVRRISMDTAMERLFDKEDV